MTTLTKLCECGCGQPAPLAPYSLKRKGWVGGQPFRFVHGHNGRGSRKPQLLTTKLCATCGEEFSARAGSTVREWEHAKFCSLDCARWRRMVARVIAGKTRVHSKGYVLVFLPMHPAGRKSYVYEHRLVMERHVGRLLDTNEHVHHRNDDKSDNRIENLELLSPRTHRAAHFTVSDACVADLIRDGWSGRRIAALGVSTHRIVRVRRDLARGMHG